MTPPLTASHVAGFLTVSFVMYVCKENFGTNFMGILFGGFPSEGRYK